MRAIKIWDVRPRLLCDTHLLREHRDIHTLYAVLHNQCMGKWQGFIVDPEILRWQDKMPALVILHDMVVEEMKRRNWSTGRHHRTCLPPPNLHLGSSTQPRKLSSIPEQLEMLLTKPCRCKNIFTVVEGHAKLLKQGAAWRPQ